MSQASSDRSTEPEQLGPGANQVLILVNPKAGAGAEAELIPALCELLRSKGFTVEVEHDLAAVAADADRLQASGKLRALVAAGGDGTIAELLNRTAPGVPIAILPLGTANLLAGYWGCPRNIKALARAIEVGNISRIDAGLANGRMFVMMAGCGFDADVVHRLHSERQGHISFWTYCKPIAWSIRSYVYPPLRVYCDPAPDGGPARQVIECRWAFVVNVPRYAMGLQFAPQGSAGDGLLNICAFQRGSFWWGLWYFVHLLFAWQGRLGDCVMTTARNVRIEASSPASYQLDGDPGGMLPLDIEVLPGRLTLLTPAEAETD